MPLFCVGSVIRIGLLGPFLALFLAAHCRGEDDSKRDLRVMSFNIRYGTANDGENHWDRRKEFVAATIAAFDPDLLGTQETLGFQRDYLAERLLGYEVLGVGRDDGGEKGEMMALYYRKERFQKLDSGHFWLSETPETKGSKSWDSSLPRMVTWVRLSDLKNPKAPPLAFFNTHFDHRGTTARLESARLLRRQVETLGKDCTVVVTGDFNSSDESDPYQALFSAVADRASPLVDTYRALHPERGEAEGTFSGFQSVTTGGPRIDWIGVSRDLQIVEAGVDRTARDGRTPSDHFPVTARLRRPKPAAEAAASKRAQPAFKGGDFEVRTVLDVPYYEGDGADARKHKLDLYLPKGHADFPVLFFIHGGAWVSGDRKLYGYVGRVFARNGIGTVVISYRLSPKVQHPGHIQDVARAFAWTHQNIGKYGGRADQIFVAGQSAGGHLAALLATDEKYLRAEGLTLKDIKGAIPISGIYRFRAGKGESIILGTGQEAADSASPLKHVSGDEPRFLILYAENDFPGCGKMSEELCRELQNKKVDVALKEIKGRDHISIIFRMIFSDADETAQELLKFVARHAGMTLQPRVLPPPSKM